MKHVFSALRAAVLVAVASIALSASAFAQTALNSTTTSAAVTYSQQIIPLTAVTNISAGARNLGGDLLFLDREAMRCNVIDTVAKTCTVTRGVGGLQTAHASGTYVYTGPQQRFYLTNPVGTCTRASEAFLPHIVIGDGNVYDCLNSEWVRLRDRGFRDFPPGRLDGGTTYTVLGAITVQPGFSFINGTTLAMTLVDPTIDQNGMVMVIIATNASAHTVTYTAGFDGGTTSRDVATYGGAVGDNMVIMAYNGTWWVLSTRNVTFG